MTTASKTLVDDLVSANHILFVEGVVDGFGHVGLHPRLDLVRRQLQRELRNAAAAHAPGQHALNHARQAGVLPRPVEQVGRKIVILEQGIDDMALPVHQQHVFPAIDGMAPAEEHIMLAVRLLVATTAGIVGETGGVLCVTVV